MVFKMNHIVIHQISQRVGLVVADPAFDLQFFFRNVNHHMRNVMIVLTPEIEQFDPLSLVVFLLFYPVVLRISWKDKNRFILGANEPLMIVRSRIDKMTYDFLVGPLRRRRPP